MIKTFDLEINGMTNSAIAVDSNDNVSIGKLLEMEGVSIESIKKCYNVFNSKSGIRRTFYESRNGEII